MKGWKSGVLKVVLLGIEAMGWEWHHIDVLACTELGSFPEALGSAVRAVWAPAKQPYLPPPLPQAESGPWRGVTSAPEGVCKNSAVEVLSDSWLSYCLSSHPAVASLLIASLCSPCTTITGLFNTQALELNYPLPLFRWLHSLPLPFWSDHAFIVQVTDVPVLPIHSIFIKTDLSIG